MFATAGDGSLTTLGPEVVAYQRIAWYQLLGDVRNFYMYFGRLIPAGFVRANRRRVASIRRRRASLGEQPAINLVVDSRHGPEFLQACEESDLERRRRALGRISLELLLLVIEFEATMRGRDPKSTAAVRSTRRSWG